MEKKKRKSFTIEFKREVLEKVDKGSKKMDLCKEFGLTPTTLSTFLSQRKTILKASKSMSLGPKRKKLTPSRHPNLDQAVFEWYKQIKCQNVPVNGPMLREKAARFASLFGYEQFQASIGWLNRFRERFSISFKVTSTTSRAENFIPVEGSPVNRLQSPETQNILLEYDREDVYNAAETALFYQTTPDISKTFIGDSCKGGKLSNIRVTVLLCTNATGSDLIKPLFIGESENPSGFIDYKLCNSLCEYRHHPKAWMDSVIFNEWLLNLNERMRHEGRKILLLMDNCTIHNNLPDLGNITVQFLPYKCTLVMQPLAAGIVRSFKTIYRKRLIQTILCKIQQRKGINVNLRESMEIASGSWRSVSQKSIQSCFALTIFRTFDSVEADLAKSIQLEEEEGLADLWEKLPPILNPDGLTFEEYVTMDDEALTSDLLSDQDIVEMIKNSALTEKVSEGDKEELIESLDIPTVSEGIESLDSLRLLLELMPNVPDRIFLVHDELKQFLVDRATQELTKKNITDFLKQL